MNRNQVRALIQLKSRLNFRAAASVLPAWLPQSFVLLFLWASILLFFAAGLGLQFGLHPAWKLDLLALLALIWWGGMVSSALAGARFLQILDLNALRVFPLSSRFLFVANILVCMADGAILPALGLIAGLSLGLLWDEGLVSMLLGWASGLWVVFSSIAMASAVLLIWQGYFYKSRKALFLVSFLLPVVGVILVFGGYFYLLQKLPAIEPLNRPDLGILETLWWLPPLSGLRILQAFVLHEPALALQAALAILLQVLMFLVLGEIGIRSLGGDPPTSGHRPPATMYAWFRSILHRLGVPLSLQAQLIKDGKLYLREPYIRLALFLPLLCATIAWLITSLVAAGTPYEEVALRVWPVWLLGTLSLSASDLFSNLFGLEREGLGALRSMGARCHEILISKIVILWGLLVFFSLLIYGVAFATGVLTPLALQVLWFEQVLIFSALVPAGIFFSLEFPMRLESSASRGLQRESFARILMILLVRVAIGFLNGLLILPILIFCIWPTLIGGDGVLLSLEAGSAPQRVILEQMGRHAVWLLYSMGPLILLWPWFLRRFEVRFPALLELVARGKAKESEI